MLKSKKKTKKYFKGGNVPNYMQYESNAGVGNTLSLAGKGASIGANPMLMGLTGGLSAPVGAALGGLAGAGKMYNNTKFGQSKVGKIAAFANPVLGISNLISNKKRKKFEKGRAEYEEQLNTENENYIENNTKGILQTYNTAGNPTVNNYANGGRIGSIQTNPQNAMDLGNGMAMFKGADHENGGIPIDTNNDMVQDAEVEGNEVYEERGKRIYSDRNKITSETADRIFKETGLKVLGTYAEVSKKIANERKKILDTGSPFSKKGSDVMNQRYDQALDMTFEDQEMTKPVENNQNFAYGGNIPKYYDGISLDNTDPNARINDTGVSFNYIKRTKNNLPVYNAPQSLTAAPLDVTNNATPKNFKPEPNLAGQPEPNLAGQPEPKVTDVAPSIKPKGGNFDMGNFGNLASQVGNYLSFRQNKKDINKMQTNMQNKLIDAPRFNYTDTSGTAKREIDESIASGTQAIQNTSMQNKGANVGKLKAEGLKARNRVNNAEADRRTGAEQNYNSLLTNVNSANVQNINANREGNLGRRNDKIALNIENRNALVKGILGNEQVRKQMKSDDMQAFLKAAQQGDTKSFNRFLDKYPQVKKYFNL